MSRNPSVSLSGAQQQLVARLVRSGRYSGVSEVVRAGLRLLESEEAQRDALVRAMEEAVRIGRASGSAKPMESAEVLATEFRKRRRQDG